MTDQTFEGFGFAEPIARALDQCGYASPTPIQIQALPPQLAGRDLLGLAETGSGKTATFLLPILQRIAANPTELPYKGVAALILAPTRELAIQIDAEVASLSRNMNIRRAVVLGGVSKGPQINALKRGVHVLVATPGRLLDHVNMRSCDLSGVGTLVIDEADRMFDMGFIRDIKKIVSMIPMKRRTALFSATMPTEIKKFAYDVLQDPYRVDLSTKGMVVDRIDQKVMIVRTTEKQSRLHTLLASPDYSRVIVFTRTKRGADRVADRLGMAGISASAFHGNKAQNARQRALNDFTQGHVRVLVATDIAARGIDVSNITHVINFDMPLDPETYVHRVGRTARKGTSGIAISLCDPSERQEIVAIERMMKQTIEVIEDVGGDVVPMAEKRSYVDPRRESGRRDGGRTPGGRRDGGGRSAAGPRQERGPMRGQDRAFDRTPERRGSRDDRGATSAGGYDPTAPKPAPKQRPRQDDLRNPSRDASRNEGGRSSERGPHGRSGEQRPGQPRIGQQRTGGQQRAGDQRNGPQRDARSDNRSDRRDDHRADDRNGHRAAGVSGDRKPANAHGTGKPHRETTRSDAPRPEATRGGGDGNWHGQQPPKFLKQRTGTQGEPSRGGR